jgi:hypothetical protein
MKTLPAGITVVTGEGKRVKLTKPRVVGQLSAPHFMKLLARLSAGTNLGAQLDFFGITGKYDWVADPLKTKSAHAKRAFAARTKDPLNPESWMYKYMASLQDQGAILPMLVRLVKEINEEEGGSDVKPVIAVLRDGTTDPIDGRGLYQIADTKAGLTRGRPKKYTPEEMFAISKTSISRAKHPKYSALRTGNPIAESSMEEARFESRQKAGMSKENEEGELSDVGEEEGDANVAAMGEGNYLLPGQEAVATWIPGVGGGAGAPSKNPL